MKEYNEFNQPVGCKVEDWHARPKPEKKILAGQYCQVVPLDVNEHACQLFAALSHDNPGDSWTYLSGGPFINCDALSNWLELKQKEQDTLLYVILDNHTNLPVGMCGYLRICAEHGAIEIGHLHFSKALKRTRLATEAIYLMMSYVFDELLYRRCEWKCNALNQDSRMAAERLGFQFEGIFRQHYVLKNRNRDTAWFSVLDQEWPELKHKFQRWLSPNNFDGIGKQKIRLQEI